MASRGAIPWLDAALRVKPGAGGGVWKGVSGIDPAIFKRNGSWGNGRWSNSDLLVVVEKDGGPVIFWMPVSPGAGSVRQEGKAGARAGGRGPGIAGSAGLSEKV